MKTENLLQNVPFSKSFIDCQIVKICQQKKSLSCLWLRRPKHLHILPLPELEKNCNQKNKENKKKKALVIGGWETFIGLF
jgi:hypothetical protein